MKPHHRRTVHARHDVLRGKLRSVPTVIIDRDLYGRVLPSQLEKILERYT